VKLTKTHITKYKSIEDSTPVDIDENVTVLVGMNEAGKSAFLESLHKTNPVLDGNKFYDVFDYPRKDWSAYKRRADMKDASVVAVLEYTLSDDEMAAIVADVGADVLTSNVFSQTHKIDNSSTVSFPVKEDIYLKRLIESLEVTAEQKTIIKTAKNINEMLGLLKEQELDGVAKTLLGELEVKFKASHETWTQTRLKNYIWRTFIKPNTPAFLYFSDYNTLPGKINIPHLRKSKESKTTDDGLKTALGLLEMANISMEELENPESYEEIKAELEAVSLNISNTVFKYWKQNKQLEVDFDVKEDPKDDAPFDEGANLYIRVKNLEHGVSVPFDQRSKGFVWFFSFIVWFNSVQSRIGTDKDLILLLDEPGLSLHGLAQADFLHYIDDLSKEHQIIYTTHSPFMIDTEKFHQVRTVEDITKKGTVVSGDLTGADKRTLFPLQAGLGYDLAQNLFIGAKNALVEGPADLIFWKYFSALLEQNGRTSLDENTVIVPTGGLDKIATFISLLSGNSLDMVVVHDYEGSRDQRLESIVKKKIIKNKQVTSYADFRDATNLKPSDVEDMISEKLYVDMFNNAYTKQLKGKMVTLKDLPKGDRIVLRIEEYLDKNKVTLRPSGGYNHYLVASHLIASPLPKKAIDEDTLKRFEDMFTAINELLNK
jgi:predicted ATP-dependent endonuclease of OLD family